MRDTSNPEPLSLRVLTDRTLIRAHAHSTRYVTAQVVAPPAPHRDERLPVDVALVLDRSGSMSDARKFELAREAVDAALRMLTERDRFSLVVYDDRIDVLVPTTHATREARARAARLLAEIHPRNSTDLGGGWLTGCEQLAEHLDRERVTRCLLLTDGLANQGITNPAELARHARELRVRGVVTSTFGVGADFDERLLRDMAHEGGGAFYFIESASQIPELLTSELGEAAEITARDVVIGVIAPGVEIESLNSFRVSFGFERRGSAVHLGDLTADQEVTIVLRATFPTGAVNDKVHMSVHARRASDAPSTAAVCELAWTFAEHAENDRQPRERSVDRAVAAVYAARAREEATEANRHGDFARARRVLEGTARRIRGYAGGDPELLGIADELEKAVRVYSEDYMAPMALKERFYEAHNALRARQAEGRAGKRR